MQLYQDDFVKYLEAIGYCYELHSHHHAYIYCLEQNPHKKSIYETQYWQWLCGLIKPEFDDIYSEIYRELAIKPDALDKMHWRDFETLVASLLNHQGYQVELGPGSNDGGKDITIFGTNALGDQLAYVQVKRYRNDKPIRLEAVQALHGLTQSDGIQKGVFVTSSRFLPSASAFAQRENVNMDLYAGEDVLNWCKNASLGIVSDKSTLISRTNLEKLLMEARTNPRNVVMANTGVTMIMNNFALIIKETKHSALLLSLPSDTVTDDGYGQRGYEIPHISANCLSRHSKDYIFRVEKRRDRNFWDGRNLYNPWDGTPQLFDYCD